MNPLQQRLWVRRQQLLRQSSDLRGRLERHSQGLVPALSAADRVWSAGVWLRAHPVVPAVALAWLAWRQPRRLLRWARRGWSAWRLLQRLRASWDERAGALGQLFGR